MKLRFLIALSLTGIFAGAQNFTATERRLITGGDTSRMLRILPMSETAGERALRAFSKDIAFNDPLLPLLKKRMFQTVMDSARRGVGIAAPQVGINRNLIWVQRFDKTGKPFEFFINPKIVWRSALLVRGAEGDLSFDDSGEVIRNYAIMVSYTDLQGAQHLEMLEAFTAVIFQHETDHLSGTLLTDRIKEQQTKKYQELKPERGGVLLQEVL